MAANFRIEVKSNRFPEIMRKYPSLLDKVIRKTTFDVTAEAQNRAPVDTGNLVMSIQPKKLGEFSWQVSTGVDYAAFVEFGTVKMRAQPYFVPAIEFVKPSYVMAVTQMLRSL